MDIDEFLDRELTEFELSKFPTKKKDNKEITSEEDLIDSSSLFGSIKDDLSKGNVEEAEISFQGLWKQFAEQKLSWDSENFLQMSELSRNFLVAFTDSLNETRKKSIQIIELLARARMFMKQKNDKSAMKNYEESKNIAESIPDTYLDDKRAIQDKIANFHREFILSSEIEAARKAANLLEQINQLISKMNFKINSANTSDIEIDYNKCINLYNQVPTGFLRNKNSAGLQILGIYKILSISAEINALQKQLGPRKANAPMQFGLKPPLQISRAPMQKVKARPLMSSQLKMLGYTKDELRRLDKQIVRKTEIKNPEAIKDSDIQFNHDADASLKKDRGPEKILDVKKVEGKKQESPKEIVKESKKIPVKKVHSSKNQELMEKIQDAKKNIERRLFHEAWKDTEAALKIAPKDVETKALRAKIMTME